MQRKPSENILSLSKTTNKLTKSDYFSIIKESHRFILDNNLTYPVNINDLVKRYNAVITSYSAFAHRSGVKAEDISTHIGNLGFSFWANNKYRIVINDAIKSPGNKLWTAMHELVHIFHGDISKDGDSLPKNHTNTHCEAVTDMLTRKILAPDCLLELYNVTAVDEVMALTGLSHTAAQIALDSHKKRCAAPKRMLIETEPYVIDHLQKSYNPMNKCYVGIY